MERKNQMKRITVLMAIFITTLITTGCGGTAVTTESTGPTYIDEAFLSDLAKGLEKRWEFSDTNIDMNEKELLTESINIELEILDDYRNKPFKNSTLQEKAIAYINQLNEGKELLTTYGSDSFYSNWDLFYGERTKAILFLTDNFEIPISEEHQPIIDEMRALGAEVKMNQEAEKAIHSLFEKTTFEYEKTEYDTVKTYVAVLENTTGFDISSISASINLIDSDDVVVDTQYIHSENWKNGQKHRFEFMTDKPFNTVDITIDYYTLK